MSEANILVIIASKLSEGARIFRGLVTLYSIMATKCIPDLVVTCSIRFGEICRDQCTVLIGCNVDRSPYIFPLGTLHLMRMYMKQALLLLGYEQ